MKKENNFELRSQRKLGILDTELNNNNNFIAKASYAGGLELGTIATENYLGRDKLQLKIPYPRDVLLTTRNPRGHVLH